MSCRGCEVSGGSCFTFHSSHKFKALKGCFSIMYGLCSWVAEWWNRGQTADTVACDRRLFEFLRPHPTPLAGSVFEVGHCCWLLSFHRRLRMISEVLALYYEWGTNNYSWCMCVVGHGNGGMGGGRDGGGGLDACKTKP